jgi:putative hydrolase of the HAD superfamily
MNSDIEFLKERFRQLARPLEPVPTDTKPILKKIGGIRFMMFDFYGTLFMSGVGDIGIDEDSRNIEAFSEALKACGLESDRKTTEAGFTHYDQIVEKHQNRLISDGYEIPEPVIQDVWLDVLNSLRDEGYISTKPGNNLARQFSVEFEIRMNPVWPMPTLDQTLASIAASGFQLGIISNSQFYTPIAFEALAGRTLDQMGFNESLLHWSYAENLKKPSLEFYKEFIHKLKVQFPDSEPGDVLYTGNDMLKDIYPAASLGMKTALFAGDQRSLKWRRDDSRCRNLEPDLVITELNQLIDCVVE